MVSPLKSHVVLSGSIEHALLKSASMDLSRTRRQLLLIAIEGGLSLYDDQTVVTALQRLTATGLFKSNRGPGRLRNYRLTPQGEQLLKVFAERPA
ncbi:hypothetical protein [Deinococcus alpinitundrae]|uniref:hypothetical protein n=1 Tax=Deinococcus alpinitundrae TaxID=468913 RepID=UPI001379D92B|nr:hypothetical protein [Deinococcus alpinitundrae]